MLATTTISKLRKTLSSAIAEIDKTTALAIMRHGETKAYLVAPELFESFVRLVEDLEDIQEGEDGIREFERGEEFEEAEEVFRDLGLQE
jgi:PHD/YefM family antitoxin component YafN of YafNO toxin-antitoxin module